MEYTRIPDEYLTNPEEKLALRMSIKILENNQLRQYNRHDNYFFFTASEYGESLAKETQKEAAVEDMQKKEETTQTTPQEVKKTIPTTNDGFIIPEWSFGDQDVVTWMHENGLTKFNTVDAF